MKYFKLITGHLLTLLLVMSSCSEPKYDYPFEAQSNGKEISQVEIKSEGVYGYVDAEQKDVIKIILPRTMDMNKMKDVRPSFKISIGSVVTPDTTINQDFTDTVRYVVVAENGTSKTWKIIAKHIELLESGFGEYSELWFKEYTTELELTKNNENTIGCIDGNVVVSRSGKVFDGLTGEAAGVINMSGIVATNPDHQIPFVFTNDDAGNLLGGTLGAWTKPNWRVYRWTTASSAPIEILNHVAVPEELGALDTLAGTRPLLMPNYGRKIIAMGDVTAKGAVSSYNVESKHLALHNVWGFAGGVPNGVTTTNTGYVVGGLYQMMHPTDYPNEYPYFFSDRGSHTGSPTEMLKYVYKTPAGGKVEKEIFGNLPPDLNTKKGSWKGYIIDIKYFKFNNKAYLAVLHEGILAEAKDDIYYVSIIDPGMNPASDKAKIVFRKKIKAPVGGANDTGIAKTNVNRTGGLAIHVEVKPEGEQNMYLYALMTGTGIVCYEFKNYDFIGEREEIVDVEL